MPRSRKTPPSPELNCFPEWVHEFLNNLGNLWSIESLTDRLTLKLSSQMTRSLGNFQPVTATIRLNSALLDARNVKILMEVLCHEAAHAAVCFLYGKRCRPHGPEWKALMGQAQYEPRSRIPCGEIFSSTLARKRKRYRYTHRCLDCGRIFRSLKTDRRWRCKSCLNQGFDGLLELVKRQTV